MQQARLAAVIAPEPGVEGSVGGFGHGSSSPPPPMSTCVIGT
jgi:hypothetical protein